jgi:hypothetical protein
MLDFKARVKRKEFKLTDIDAGISPDYPTERTGRCHTCNIRFIWPDKLGRLKDMSCPICGTALAHTTHMFKGRTVKISLADVVTVTTAPIRITNPETGQYIEYTKNTARSSQAKE